jgi:serine/threonine protein kinase
MVFDLNRQVIDLQNGNVVLTLYEADGCGNPIAIKEFTITDVVGCGSSTFVYEAQYASGGVMHSCILKELYPTDCGLLRAMEGASLLFSVCDSKRSLEYHERYKKVREKYVKAYELQSMLHSASHAKISTVEDRMLLANGVSATVGLYVNQEGILYSVYSFNAGKSYDQYDVTEETLWDILSIVIQTGNTISVFHKAGYVVLDIKEANLLVTGDKTHRTALQFDFDSLVSKEELKAFSFHENQTISFTATDPDVLLPAELRSIKRNCEDGKYIDAQETINRRLAVFGERTDVFMLAVILYRRLFGSTPMADTVKKLGEWVLPESSHCVTIPVRTMLYEILSKALAKRLEGRYQTMEDFLRDLKHLQSFAFLESTEERNRLTDGGVMVVETYVSKGTLLVSSRRQWEAISTGNGRFSELVEHPSRYPCTVFSTDGYERTYTPQLAMDSHRYVLLTGDGGMGKSTALFDYWSTQLSNAETLDHHRVCLYLDLSQFMPIPSIGLNDLPVHLLAQLMVGILRTTGIVPAVAKSSDVLLDLTTFKQTMALHTLFSKCTDDPEYVLLLDGYNEILSAENRMLFESELSKAVALWGNVSIVVTTRTLPTHHGALENDGVFTRYFSTFSLRGIPDEYLEATLADSTVTTHERLFEVLSVPAFLSVYLDETTPIHTMGALLDDYITHSELQTAKRVTKSSNDTFHVGLRAFITQFSLPLVAHYMDEHGTLSLPKDVLYAEITEGNLLFLTDGVSWGDELLSVYDSFTSSYVTKAEMGFDVVEYIEHILSGCSGLVADVSLKVLKKMAMQVMVPIDTVLNVLIHETGYLYVQDDGNLAFSRQYLRDYFSAKHIHNMLSLAKVMEMRSVPEEVRSQYLHGLGAYSTLSDGTSLALDDLVGDSGLRDEAMLV